MHLLTEYQVTRIAELWQTVTKFAFFWEKKCNFSKNIFFFSEIKLKQFFFEFFSRNVFCQLGNAGVFVRLKIVDVWRHEKLVDSILIQHVTQGNSIIGQCASRVWYSDHVTHCPITATLVSCDMQGWLFLGQEYHVILYHALDIVKILSYPLVGVILWPRTSLVTCIVTGNLWRHALKPRYLHHLMTSHATTSDVINDVSHCLPQLDPVKVIRLP